MWPSSAQLVVCKVSHKVGFFQFNNKLNKDASERRNSIKVFSEAQTVKDVLYYHDDIQTISSLHVRELLREMIEHYVVRTENNVIVQVSGLSDGVIEFLTDSHLIGNFTLNQ